MLVIISIFFYKFYWSSVLWGLIICYKSNFLFDSLLISCFVLQFVYDKELPHHSFLFGDEFSDYEYFNNNRAANSFVQISMHKLM